MFSCQRLRMTFGGEKCIRLEEWLSCNGNGVLREKRLVETYNLGRKGLVEGRRRRERKRKRGRDVEIHDCFFTVLRSAGERRT